MIIQAIKTKTIRHATIEHFFGLYYDFNIFSNFCLNFPSQIDSCLTHDDAFVVSGSEDGHRRHPEGAHDVHRARTRLVSLENTCNRGGGSCYDLAEIAKIRTLCDAHGLGLHLDGARLMNAIVAKKEDPQAYGKMFHSISLCLSKGLGAPIGSVLVGSNELIAKARQYRKLFGGGMRQTGLFIFKSLFKNIFFLRLEGGNEFCYLFVEIDLDGVSLDVNLSIAGFAVILLELTTQGYFSKAAIKALVF